jgi:hypothetical protein
MPALTSAINASILSSNPGETPFVLGDEQRLETAFKIARDLDAPAARR